MPPVKPVERPEWPALMRRSTAALYLDVSQSTFDVWVSAGRIARVHPCVEAMYRRVDLDAFVAGLTSQPRVA